VFSTDRAMLRSLLLTDLVEGKEIQFDMAFKRYQILPSGRVQVQFENGTCVEGTVLVGADGTTSRVRRQYIPRHITLLDTDSGAIYGKTPLTPDIEQYFATGSTTMITGHDPNMALVIEPRGATTFGADCDNQLPELDDYLCWVLFARAGQFHVRENMTVHDLYAMAPEEVAELSMEITSHWCPRVRALLETQDPEWASFLRISSMSPDIKPWQPSVITLLGDAVHTMTPAGIGCNTALHDARTLVRLFCEHGVNVHAVEKYEQAAREHGRDGIAFSLEASARMFGMPHVMDMRAVVY
jgi:2-polyprenyl-6-methoxyphenol hydroxylase-like FAD-dependent oxidoreductase